MSNGIQMIMAIIILTILLAGLGCFSWGWLLLSRPGQEESLRRSNQQANIFLAVGSTLIAIAFLLLMLIVKWPISIKAGFVLAGSLFPLLWAAYYSRASLLYNRKAKPIALDLGLMGTLIAVLGGEAILFPLHLPRWFALLYGLGVFVLVLLITCLLQMHWQRAGRQRQWLEKQDPEILLLDEKERGEERFVLRSLLLFVGCFLVAAGAPAALFSSGISLGWAAVIIISLSAALIFWGEYHIRAHLLYGYKKKPGIGWAVFLGVLLISFYTIVYLSTVIDVSLLSLSYPLILVAQTRLSRRWETRGEQRQAIRPGTDMTEMLEHMN